MILGGTACITVVELSVISDFSCTFQTADHTWTTLSPESARIRPYGP